MSAVPKVLAVTHYRVRRGREVLYPLLANEGTSELPPGRLIAWQKLRDGTFKRYEAYNPLLLGPGETSRLTLQLYNTRPLELVEYVIGSGPAEASPKLELDGNRLLKRRLWRWSLKP